VGQKKNPSRTVPCPRRTLQKDTEYYNIGLTSPNICIEFRRQGMPTIIYPPTIDYSWLYQRPQQLLKEVAALGHKVIFYNNEVYVRQKASIAEPYPNFLLCKPDIPIKYLRVEKPVISWITYPPHVSQVGRYGEDLTVFDAVDAASEEFEGWAGYVDRISQIADIVFTTSGKLYSYHSERHQNVYLCPNGADYEHFSRSQRIFTERPADLPKNHNPIIGYFGALAPWLDWNLIYNISRLNKHLNFVMLGPFYGNFRNIVRSDNIYYLGRKDYSILPAYLQYFDVCIIPFRVTPMTEACNPIKIYEYLSAGKPVVTTCIPEISGIKAVYTAATKKEFNRKIHEALGERFDEDKILERVKFAQNNSWKRRASMVADIIHRGLKVKMRKNKFKMLWQN
jgi:glycosyltransferase involved in cell wall biosynthesis